MRTPLVWTLRVTISPWNSLPDFLKEPMLAMSLLLAGFEPATTAASMAIGRPEAIDDAPARGPERSGGFFAHNLRVHRAGPEDLCGRWRSRRRHLGGERHSEVMIRIRGETLATFGAAEEVPMARMLGALLRRGGADRHPAHRVAHLTRGVGR